MSLPKIAPEILDLITQNISSFDIGRLWLCGDHVLCQLMRYGVRKMEITLSFSCWPSFVSQLTHLSDFTLRTPEMDYENLEDMKTTPLPPHLTSLSVQDQVLEKIVPFFPSLLQSLKHLKIMGHIVSNATYIPHLIASSLVSLTIESENSEEANTITNLTSLSLQTYGSYGPTPPDVDISALHRLETLRVEALQPINSIKLPSALTVLKLIDHSLDLNQIMSLPRHLTYLRYSVVQFTEEHVKALPTSLRSLSLVDDRIWGPADPINFTHTMASLLPRELQSLKLMVECNIGFTARAVLPSSLTALKILALTSLEEKHAPNTYFQLPSQLSQFEIRGYINPTHFPSILSPNIKRFVFHGVLGLKEGCIHVMPSSNADNKDYDLTNETIPVDNNYPFLFPPSLTYLSITLSVTAGDVEQDPVLLLPSTLEYLDLTTIFTARLPLILPPKLTHLRLSVRAPESHANKMFPGGWNCYLPKTLESFYLDALGSVIHEDFFPTLNLPHLNKIEVRHPISLPSTVMNQLPISLTSISIRFERGLDWNIIDLGYMKHLRSLDIYTPKIEYPMISQNWIQKLPKRLVQFSFDAPFEVSCHPEILAMMNAHIDCVVVDARSRPITF
jgi:hypothetical protein